MKGVKIYVAILTPIALALGIVMAVKDWAESWSQNHTKDHDYILYATLQSIIITFWSAADKHPDKERKIIKGGGWWKIPEFYLKSKYVLRATSIFFMGVAIFGVNNNSALVWGLTVSHLHLLFTGFSIASGYLLILTYPETAKGFFFALGGTVFGIGGFLLGYKFHLWSIGWGEVLAAFPFAIWMIVTYVIFGTKFYYWLINKFGVQTKLNVV